MGPEHPAERIVLHVDMDCFFAAVELREDPSLKGKPVVVGADPKGGRGRGIVATCSYEARRFGIRSAMPISTAWRLCPKAVFLPPRFSLYSQASRRVMSILSEAADVFEPAGVDEAYLDVSSKRTFEAARELAKRLRSDIRAKERLSCSIGVAPNKLIAKMASDHKKPGGLTVVIPSRVREFLDPKDVGALRGVGPKTKEALNAMGLATVAQLRAAPESRLAAAFGKFGLFLWREARGSDDRPVDPSWEAKSMGREHTFERDTADREEVERTLAACVRRVQRDLTQDGHWCRTLTVKVRFAGYETHSRQMTLRQPTGDPAHMERAAATMIEPFLRGGRPVRLVGFSAGGLVPPEDLLPLR